MADASRTVETDEELVRRVQRGETELFAVIFERHQAQLARFLRQVGVSAADVEDLLGETFCRALDKIDYFDSRSGNRYLSYLYSIARNLATDRARYLSRVTSLEELEESWGPSDGRREETLVDEIYQREQIALVRRAMERLSPTDREIVVLAYDRELTSREIMEITGKPSVTAVTTHIYKAMKKLREHVAGLAAETGAR
jgi:RNA polymerase sigma-70 factor (ECF subfamily)